MIQPIGEIIFVKPDEKSNKTASGMHIPQEQQEKTQTGTVMARGPLALQTTDNDKVLFGKFSGAEFQDPGHGTLFIMRESSLLAILK